MFEALPSSPDALTLRNRLVKAFLEAEGSGLVLHSVAGPAALLTSLEGAHVVFVAALEGLPPAAIEEHVRALLEAGGNGPLALIIVGGDERPLEALRGAADRTRGSRRRTIAFVTVDGRVRTLAGPPLPALEPAVARARAEPPLAQVDLSALAVAQSNALRQERDFALRLRATRPYASFALVALNATLFAAQLVFGGSGSLLADARMGALSQAGVVAGEWWRLWASTLLHGGLLHLVFNMVALLSLAPFLETVLGSARFFSLYALAGLGGALLSAALHADGYAVGASGAIWGVMGGSAALVLRPRGLVPPMTSGLLKRRAWVPIAVNVAISFLPGIDLWSHLGGGATGFVLVLAGAATAGLAPVALGAPPLATRRITRLWPLASATLLAAAMLGSSTAAILRGRPWELRWPPPLIDVELAGAGLRQALPAGAEPREETRDGSPHRAFAWGDLRVDPLAVIVQIVPSSVPSDAPEAAVAPELLQELTDAPIADGTKRLEEAFLDRRDGVTWARDAHVHANGVELHRACAILGGRFVLTTALLNPGAGGTWRRLVSSVVTGTALSGPGAATPPEPGATP